MFTITLSIPVTCIMTVITPKEEAMTTTDQHGDAQSAFTAAYGYTPTGLWSAPGRVNLIGEHTDYNHGLCLPTITPHRAFIAVRLRDDAQVRVVADDIEPFVTSGSTWSGTLDAITPESAAGWPAYVAGVLWALQERGFSGPGMDVAVVSCVPAGAALGHAAAVEAATALAVNDLWKLALNHEDGLAELAECCVDSENLIAGRISGGLEQHTALRCHENEAVLLDFRGEHPEATTCPLYFPDYGLALLVIDTQRRVSVDAGVSGMRSVECERAARELGFASLRELHHDPRRLARLHELTEPALRKRARHVYSENDRVMLVRDTLNGTEPAHERFIAVGQALSRSHHSLDADFEVSSPELNLAVMAATNAGALGGRLIGGGIGGSVMTLVRRSHAERIAATISSEFLEAGFKRPQFLLV
jgi:galactokinase